MNDLTGLKTRLFKNSGDGSVDRLNIHNFEISIFFQTHTRARTHADALKKVRTIAALRVKSRLAFSHPRIFNAQNPPLIRLADN
jgi:hypothetical protein